MPEDYQIIDLTLTLPRNPNSPYTPRDMASIHWIVVHHSTGPPDQTPETIARFHVETRGGSGIGYNYLVYEDSRIFVGRPLDVLPACVKGHNEGEPVHLLCGRLLDPPPIADGHRGGRLADSPAAERLPADYRPPRPSRDARPSHSVSRRGV